MQKCNKVSDSFKPIMTVNEIKKHKQVDHQYKHPPLDLSVCVLYTKRELKAIPAFYDSLHDFSQQFHQSLLLFTSPSHWSHAFSLYFYQAKARDVFTFAHVTPSLVYLLSISSIMDGHPIQHQCELSENNTQFTEALVSPLLLYEYVSYA